MSEENIVLYLNIIVALSCVWIAMYVNFKCLYESTLNSKRFKLFELRDRLTIMVMKSDLDKESQEYKIMSNSLNHYIKATENFRIVTFLKSVWSYGENEEYQREIEKIIQNIENHSPEFKQIFTEYNNAMTQLFGKRVIFSCYILLVLLFVPVMLIKSKDYAINLWHNFGDLRKIKGAWGQLAEL